MKSKPRPAKKESTKDDLLRKSFGEALRKWRALKDAGSQADLAKKAGLPAYTVGALEREEKPVDLMEIARICEAMGVDISTFLDDVTRNQVSFLLPFEEKLRGEQPQEVRELSASRPALREAVDLVCEAAKRMFLDLAEHPERPQEAK
jgi:transcriptional regulator with XRE-family HTH domain